MTMLNYVVNCYMTMLVENVELLNCVTMLFNPVVLLSCMMLYDHVVLLNCVTMLF